MMTARMTRISNLLSIIKRATTWAGPLLLDPHEHGTAGTAQLGITIHTRSVNHTWMSVKRLARSTVTPPGPSREVGLLGFGRARTQATPNVL